MSTILLNILYTIITGCGATLVTFLCTYIKKKINELTQNKHINLATEAVIDSVNAIAMKYVDDLKEAGEFTKEAQERAKQDALEIIDTLVNDKAKNIIEDVYQDFQTWASNKIESILKEKKSK